MSNEHPRLGRRSKPADLRHLAQEGTMKGKWRIVSTARVLPERAPATVHAQRNIRRSEFRLEGEYWSISYEGSTSRIKDGKGPRVIAYLLSRPGQEFYALELVGVAEGPRDLVAAVRSAVADDLHVACSSDAGDVLDPQAREAYRLRVEDLRDEIADAESWNDPERFARARAELDALTAELSAAVGLGGRSRKAASDVERARINITRAIGRTVQKLAIDQPTLGMYFATTIRTGTYCSYTPDPRIPVDWSL